MDLKLTLLTLVFLLAVTHGFSRKRQTGIKPFERKYDRRLGIFGGHNTTIENHPYMASVISWFDDLVCSATIVSNQWVLTVASRMYIYPFRDIALCVGCQDAVTGLKYYFEDAALYPNYDYDADYDYILLKIQGSFSWSKSVQPAKLPRAPPKANTKVITAGWGNAIAGDYNGWILREGSMTWLSTSKCKAVLKGYGVTWTKRMACVYNKGKTTLCPADFGDPFVKNGVFYGMWEWLDHPGRYCNASSPPLLVMNTYAVSSWIKKTTGAMYEDE